jgi:hypothetical protein
MTFEHTTSQVLFDRDGHRCIRFSSLVKGEGVQANQFLIIDQQRAAVLDPGGDLTYMPLTMELNKYTVWKIWTMSWLRIRIQILLPLCLVGWSIRMPKWWLQNFGHDFYRI